MERFRSDTRPHAGHELHEHDDDAHDRRSASLAALAFLIVVALGAAAIVGAQHARTALDDCAVQEGGVCVALSGR